MAIYFVDSSAIAKRYINEVGSAWVLELFNPTLNNEIFVAAITGVEIVAAVTRRSRNGSIRAADAKRLCEQVRNDLKTDYQVIELIESIIDAAIALAETHGLRGYDAVQLAAGCAIHQLCVANGLPTLIFVSADDELNLAATNEGLLVENPNHYP